MNTTLHKNYKENYGEIKCILQTNVNVVRNGQDMKMIQKDFRANCKEDYGKIKLHLFASTSKNIANVAWESIVRRTIWTITIGVFLDYR
jgi:hypothetical protein